MNKLLLFACSLLMAAGASAATSAQFEGVEIGPLVDYYRDYIYQLDKSIFVYSDVKFSAPNSLTSPLSTRDPIGLRFAQAASEDFWAGLPDLRKYRAVVSNPGLSAQLDPVIAQRKIIEQNSPNWALLEIELPRGFRFVNFMRDGDNSAPRSVSAVLKALQCNTQSSKYLPQSDLSMSFWRQSSELCQRAMREIARAYLNVDGFFWKSASSAYFKECVADPVVGGALNFEGASRSDRNGAFTLVRGSALPSGSVSVFNAQTRADRGARLRLQSLSYKSGYDQSTSGSFDWGYASDMSHYPGYETYHMLGTSSGCTGAVCTYTSILCPTGVNMYPDPSCVEVPAARPPQVKYPTLIGETTPLLWSDLAGSWSSPEEELSPLVQKFFGCQPTVPYSLAR